MSISRSGETCSYQDAYSFYTAKKYEEALSSFTEAAEHHDHTLSQYYLGSMYEQGQGTPQNFDLAETWYKKSGYSGNKDAQYCVAMMYYEGRTNIPQDYPRAFQWFTRAVDNNPYQKGSEEHSCDKAQFYMAEMYFYGRGVNPNKVEAFEWYQKSAQLGNTSAQYELGRSYREGLGTSKDYNKAKIWFERAARNGGHKDAQFNMGYMHHHGEGVHIDGFEALMWYRLSANQGVSESQRCVGLLYYEGKLIPQDYNEAVIWFQKSVDNDGDEEALNKLGYMYRKGLGVVKSYEKALEYYTRSAEFGNYEAILSVKWLKRTSPVSWIKHMWGSKESATKEPHIMKTTQEEEEIILESLQVLEIAAPPKKKKDPQELSTTENHKKKRQPTQFLGL